jgi:SAM-dependent methyltransferase
MRYDELLDPLREAYDAGAQRRDGMQKQPWKVAERDSFLARLREAGCVRLLELGAGTGQDSLFFQEQGLDVVAVDLSPENVARCREKGVDARVMDFLHLDFPPESFDAAYALNCLLHVPNADLPAVLRAIQTVLRPGGLFFLGVYGAEETTEGIHEKDWHRPPRFFSRRTDEQLQRYASECFEILDFHTAMPDDEYWPFQSLTLRRHLHSG